ncbi:uncharacterized protein LOC124613662 [Schistocerca americana]|uniref:uncharacterized protein LOC124613662 n=1 Tax=Schistocerca americana TaxID=7009 RepID=UPI001F4F85E7|nr:uncharacterized protein LOC124613662 [Schistocerca americana]
MTDELCEDEASNHSQEDLFSMSLLEILDRVIMELCTRFTALENISGKFTFLYDVQIQEMEAEDIKTKAAEVSDTYTEDLKKEDFIFEIESFKHHDLVIERDLQNSTASSTLSLIYKNKLVKGYPNITVVLRILLTIPVSVSSGERSFSKLKLIKNHLRRVTAQRRLTNLSIISTEYKQTASINYDDIISVFAAKKARKAKF